MGWATGISARRQALLEWYASRQVTVLPPQLFDERESRLIRARSTPFVLMRLCGRAFSWIYAARLADRPKAFKKILAVSVAFDLAEGVVLRRASRGYAPHRAVRDIVETAVHAAMGVPLAGTSISASPLAVEVAFRVGAPSGVVVGSHVATAAATRALLRRDGIAFDDLAFLGVAAATGLSLRRVETVRVSTTFKRLERARSDAAMLDARSAGRMFAFFRRPDGPAAQFPSFHEALYVAVLTGCDWQGLPDESPVRRVLGNRRPALVRGEAAYLANAMRQWADLNRQAHSVASRQVVSVRFAHPDFEKVLLTRPQMASLVAQCERKSIAGDVIVTRVRHGIVGDAVSISLSARTVDGEADEVVRIPADRDGRWYRLTDALPEAMWIGALWAATQATRCADAVAVESVLPGVLAFLVGSSVSEFMARRFTEDVAGPLTVDLAMACSAVQLWSIVRQLDSPSRPDGTPRLPVQNALLCPAIVAGYAWPQQSGAQRTRHLLEVALLSAFGIAMLERPRPWSSLIVNTLLAPGVAAVGALIYRNAVDAEAQRVTLSVHDEAQREFDAAACEEEAEEWTLLATAADEAIELVKKDLDPESTAFVESIIAHVSACAHAFAADCTSRATASH